MATGGKPLSRTLMAGCDVFYDFSCSPCERRNGTNSEANYYCTECDEFFCKTCLEFHGSFQQTKDHNILGRDKVSGWRKQKKSIKKPVPAFQEQCMRHPGQHVTMFCANHNALLCHVCVSLEHRNCEGMQYIPGIAAGIKQSPYYSLVKKDFERVQSNINIVKKSRHQIKGSLDKSRKDFVDIIRDFRKQINTIFDELETKATADTDKVHKESTSNADNDLEACDTFLADLEQFNRKLEFTLSDNKYQTFVNMLSEFDDEIQTLAKTKDNLSNQLTIDKKLTSFLTDIQNLEELSMKQSTPSNIDTDTLHKESTSNAENGLEAGDTFLADLERHCQQLEPNEYQTFINLNFFEYMLSECDDEIQRLAETSDNLSYQWTIDQKLTSFLTGIHNLGELSIKHSTPSNIDTKRHVQQYNNKDT